MRSICFHFVLFAYLVLTCVALSDIQVSWVRVVWYGKHTLQALQRQAKESIYSGQV